MIEISILLGIVQGLTEFLPISSSGHLVLLAEFLHFDPPGLLFDVLVHFGTLGSVIYIFRRRIGYLIRSPFMGGENLKLLFFLGSATVPIAVTGLVFGKSIEKTFDQMQIVGFSLLFTGGLLYLAEKVDQKERGLNEMSLLDSILIGIMQVFSLLPGVSRSGATITTGLFRGLNRRLAAEFSFLLSIPAILGATLVKLGEVIKNPTEHHSFLGVYIIGTVFAFITGLIAIKTLLLIIQKKRLDVFAYYCWGVGFLTLMFFYLSK
jgi:undecaprenyl-diphosphatase